MRLKGFKLRKNNSFKYVPRYLSEKSEENKYSFDSKFMKYRETPNSLDFRVQWGEARKVSRNRGNREVNVRLIVIIGVLLFLVLWFFDFDLSLLFRGF